MTVEPRKTHKWVRAVVDYGGLAAFLGAYVVTRDLMSATWGLLAGSLAGVALALIYERRIAPMPATAAAAAVVFGGLTLIFHDPVFIKIKATVINLAFAAFLLGGLALKRLPLKALLGEAWPMPDEGWRTLSLRYGLYFLAVAGINEIVWRTQPEAVWVAFRFPGLQLMALAFSLTQIPLMMRYAKTREPPPPPID
jgi:intracellular septation protein